MLVRVSAYRWRHETYRAIWGESFARCFTISGAGSARERLDALMKRAAAARNLRAVQARRANAKWTQPPVFERSALGNRIR
jgi:hypothetical protein